MFLSKTLSLECYKQVVHISIKLQSLKPKEIFFIKVKTCPSLPKTPHLNTPPHIYVTVLEDLHKTAQMFTQRKKALLLFLL